MDPACLTSICYRNASNNNNNLERIISCPIIVPTLECLLKWTNASRDCRIQDVVPTSFLESGLEPFVYPCVSFVGLNRLKDCIEYILPVLWRIWNRRGGAAWGLQRFVSYYMYQSMIVQLPVTLFWEQDEEPSHLVVGLHVYVVFAGHVWGHWDMIIHVFLRTYGTWHTC
jgi:hypothetical protein